MNIVVFRTDASIYIGSGHVMRCLILADKLSLEGVLCYFMCYEHKGHMLSLIKERGHQVLFLRGEGSYSSDDDGNEYSNWLGCSLIEDIQLSIDALHKLRKVDCLVVDHYALDKRWEQRLHSYCKCLMVIDDLANRYHDCDLLLDQNSLIEKHILYSELCPEGCKLLLGDGYTLLKPELCLVHRKRREHFCADSTEGSILLFMGGVDERGLTLRLLKEMDLSSNCVKGLHVLVGGMSLSRVEIKEWCVEHGIQVTVAHKHVESLFSTCRAAIVACGKFAVELQAMEIPCILIPLSDIQLQVAEYFVEYGRAIMIKSGDVEREVMEINMSLSNLLSLPFHSSLCGMLPFDGVDKVVKEMMDFSCD